MNQFIELGTRVIWLILPPPTAAPVMLSEPVDNNADGDTDDRDNNHIVN